MLNSRDIDRLRADVAENCRRWLERCGRAGLAVLVTNTVRDAAYQAWLYEQGRTRPGSIVTNGKLPTFHDVEAGLAFDFCKNVKGQEYSDAQFFAAVAAGRGVQAGNGLHIRHDGRDILFLCVRERLAVPVVNRPPGRLNGPLPLVQFLRQNAVML